MQEGAEPIRDLAVGFRRMGYAFSKYNRPGLPVKNPFAASCSRCRQALVSNSSTPPFYLRWYRYQLAQQVLVVLAFSVSVELCADDASAGSANSSATRLVSTKIFDAVTAKLPKYAPPTPVKDTDSNSSERSDEGSDGTMKLPKITVRPTTVGPSTDAVFLTPKARLALAMKANPGLRLGNVLGSNDGIASFMQTEEIGRAHV